MYKQTGSKNTDEKKNEENILFHGKLSKYHKTINSIVSKVYLFECGQLFEFICKSTKNRYGISK